MKINTLQRNGSQQILLQVYVEKERIWIFPGNEIGYNKDEEQDNRRFNSTTLLIC